MIREHCALFGIVEQEQAISSCVYGLHALQHRGEEASGVVTIYDNKALFVKGIGKVSEVFNDDNIASLKSFQHFIGHNRYSVTGENNLDNVHPLIETTTDGETFALAHNGNLTNLDELKQILKPKNISFRSSMDTELIVHLIANSDKKTFEERLIDSLAKLEGSFSLLIIKDGRLYAVRDPKGMRPLSIGKKENSYAFASETCAFDLLGFEHVRDLKPGEVICYDFKTKKIETIYQFEDNKKAQCIFELIYFARPDSKVFNHNVYQFRKQLGAMLAKRYPVKADLVMPVPDSGVYSALGYAQASGITYEHANIRNHYVGRSFIQPTQDKRELVARLKNNPISDIIKGKSIVVVDDSIVRGVTSKHQVNVLRKAGAREIHFLIASPPVKNPCYYGIDFPTKEELIANQMTLEEMRKHLGVDTLGYLEIDDLKQIAKDYIFCDACFSGNYPIAIKQALGKDAMK